MPDPAEMPAPAESAVSARRCRHCGYLLAGLRKNGNCPECGEPFDLDEIVLFGWAHGTRRNAIYTPSTVQSIVLFVVGTLGISIQLFPILFYSGPYSRLALGFGIAVLAGLLAIHLLRRSKAIGLGHPPHQVRITSNGFGQRDGVGAVALTPWSRDYRATMDPLKQSAWRLQIRHRRAWVGFYGGVNFEFDAQPAEAAAVLERLSAWREAAAMPHRPKPASDLSGHWDYERLRRPP